MFQADRGKWGRVAHTHTYCHLSVGAALKRWRAVNGKLVLSTYPPFHNQAPGSGARVEMLEESKRATCGWGSWSGGEAGVSG